MPKYKNYNLETTSDSWEIKRFYIKCQDSLDYIHLRRISLQISNILNKRLPIFFFFFLLRRHEKYQRWLFSVNYFEIHSLSNSFRKVQYLDLNDHRCVSKLLVLTLDPVGRIRITLFKQFIYMCNVYRHLYCNNANAHRQASYGEEWETRLESWWGVGSFFLLHCSNLKIVQLQSIRGRTSLYC